MNDRIETPKRATTAEKPMIAITMGDPAGVGPEIIIKALRNPAVQSLCRPLVIGDQTVMAHAADALGLESAIPPGNKLLDLGRFPEGKKHVWGVATAQGGQAGAAYVERAVELALEKQVAAIVTAPLNKEALHMGGVPFPGHTEMIASLTGTSDYAMMLVGTDLRVIHVSTHVSLFEAVQKVKRPRIERVISLAHDALRKEGISKPRIAVAGLNPHAGEGGLFGREEIDEIAPAVQAMRAQGVNVTGPHPPDTVFWHASNDRFDIVVAMYHDQGHIPAKLAGFERAVNVTVGLPIIRVSVDHGTAYDIAGTGQANDASLIEALRYAVRVGEEQELRR